MSLRDRLVDDVLAILPDLGEPVVYRPASGAPRTIHALVERLPPEDYADVEVPGPVVRITVANHHIYGISSAELDTGRDVVDVAVRAGERPVARPIAGLVGPHARGALTLEVR